MTLSANSHRAAPAPNNLPAQPTPMIGRARELATVGRLLHGDAARLLTLTGPGGVGKTRLALAAAETSFGELAHGAWFVDLAPLSDTVLALSAIARALGVRTEGRHPLLERIQRHLRDRRLLLLLDNCEHLLEVGSAVAELLKTCPGLTVLATSREPLRLRWEQRFPVPPLAVPDLRDPRVLDSAARVASVALFVERARAVRPHFALGPDSIGAVAELCVRLDGLPLAIELAAAHSDLLSPSALLQRLERRLPLPARSAPDLPTRHRTLRAAVDWSHDLLSPSARALFCRLGVFAGGWTLDAGEAVAGLGAEDTLTLLDSLVDKGLIQPVDDRSASAARRPGQRPKAESLRDAERGAPVSGPRFRMLGTIREYALERLEMSGELEEARRRHAAHFLQLAEMAEPELRGPDQTAWLERLEREHDNLRAALRWALDAGLPEPALRLGGALWRFWHMHGHVGEGLRWLEDALALNRSAPPNAQSSIAVCATALAGAGWLNAERGDDISARSQLEQSLAIWRELGDARGMAYACMFLGSVASYQDRRDEARSLSEESIARFRAADDRWGLGVSLTFLGELERGGGDHGRAAALYAESLALVRALGDQVRAAVNLHNLGHVAQALGDPRAAEARFRESLTLHRELGNTWGVAYCLAGLSWVAATLHQWRRTARLSGAAEALFSALGVAMQAVDRVGYDGGISLARQALGPAFDRASAAGRAMSSDEAIAYVLTEPLTPSPAAAIETAPPAIAPANPLSAREREVLRLVATGYSNKQIARELVITERTVKAHVTTALNKLGADNRAQAAVIATERGLL